MNTVEMLKAYEEYKTDCYWEGRTPVSYYEWLEGKE